MADLSRRLDFNEELPGTDHLDPLGPVDRSERYMRRMADRFRRTGRTLAADNLQHYLDGGGKARLLSDFEVERHRPVLDAEADNRKRFERETFLGATGSKEFNSRLAQLRSGAAPAREWMDLGADKWDRDVTWGKNLLQWLIPGGGDDDFAVAIGSSKIRSRGQFEGRRLDDDRIELRGTVIHAPVRKEAVGGKEGRRAGELYDFNWGPGTNEARHLEGAGRAKPFLVKWFRPERVTATLERGRAGTWQLRGVPAWRKLDQSDIGDGDAWFAED